MIEFSNLNFIDWIILSLLLATSIIGFSNGFIKEFLNFVSHGIALIISFVGLFFLIEKFYFSKKKLSLLDFS